MRKPAARPDRFYIKSLAKGLGLLASLGQARSPMSLSEITQSAGLNITTASRLCHTLSQLGYIERDALKRYRLTPKSLDLGFAYLVGLPWRDISEFFLRRLFDEVQETVNLSVLEDTHIRYVIRIQKEEYLPINIHVGTKLPAFCTAMGKVLLAFVEDKLFEDILDRIEFKPLTSHTITDKKAFRQEIERVRRLGYAIADEELSLGNRVIAAPILDGQGNAIAAINIAFPSTSFSRSETEAQLGPVLIARARELSRALERMDLARGDVPCRDVWDEAFGNAGPASAGADRARGRRGQAVRPTSRKTGNRQATQTRSRSKKGG